MPKWIALIAAAIVLLALSLAMGAAPVSGLIKHDAREDLTGAILTNVMWDAVGEGGLILDAEGLASGAGSITSAPIKTEFPFNNAVPSWNLVGPSGTGVIVELRVSSDGTSWTNWYEIASWHVSGKRGSAVRSDSNGKVDADTLILYRHYQYLQYRLTLIGSRTKMPRLKLVTVSYADTARQAPVSQPVVAKPGRRVELPVPFRSQRDASPTISSRVCSPTSLAMVLEYFGFEFSTDEVAAMAYDSRNDIYGNWPFNTAVAGQLGLEAYVTRFPDFTAIEEEIARGNPVVISIRYGFGELFGAPVSKSNGHLVVVVGFTENGDVIVNDPAGHGKDTGRVVYRREELRKAWKNGVAYIIRRRDE